MKKPHLSHWVLFIALQCMIVAVVISVIYKHENKARVIKLPPASLAQWYKPENKRQVWLHTMFKLRREMQAVQYYADNQNEVLMTQWAGRLSEHYLKVGEMVPEWEGKLDTDTLAELQVSVKNKQFENVSAALDRITESCDSCHTDYRATTALMYRAPDFSNSQLSTSVAYDVHMDQLTRQVNQIKIASEDGLTDVALSSLSDLKAGMTTLGETCSNCHTHDPITYPNETISNTLIELEENLKTGTVKDQGRTLGTLAVIACASCHGTHRLSFDARKQLSDTPDWAQLLKH